MPWTKIAWWMEGLRVEHTQNAGHGMGVKRGERLDGWRVIVWLFIQFEGEFCCEIQVPIDNGTVPQENATLSRAKRRRPPKKTS